MAQQGDVVIIEHKLVGVTLCEVTPGEEWDVVALHEGQAEAEVIGSVTRAYGRLSFSSREGWGHYPATLRRIADLVEAKEGELDLDSIVRASFITMQAGTLTAPTSWPRVPSLPVKYNKEKP